MENMRLKFCKKKFDAHEKSVFQRCGACAVAGKIEPAWNLITD
jgi:hypothetical protein